jgi:hypothetical protein
MAYRVKTASLYTKREYKARAVILFVMKSASSITKAFLGAIFFLASISQNTSAQKPPISSRKQQSTNVSSLTAKILDKKTSSLKRSAAWDQLYKLPAAPKTEALRRIIISGDSENAGQAASVVTYDRVPGLGPLIAANIMRWDDAAQSLIMGNILTEVKGAYRQPWFWEAARQVLRGFIKKGKRQSWEDTAITASQMVDRTSPDPNEKDRMTAPGSAALVLRYSGAAADQALLQQAVALDPQSLDLWAALASYGKLRPQEQTLARAAYQNTKLPEIYRMHAAVALAPSDATVAAYVVQEFQNNLAAVEKINIVEVSAESMRQLYSKEPGAQEKTRQLLKLMAEFGLRANTLAAVRHLQLPIAQELVFTLVTSRELQLRIMGGMIAIERYPERFLPLLDRKHYPADYPDLYENMCAVFVLWHPQYKAQILKKLPAAKLNAALKRIQTQKVTPIPWSIP